ncbi:MAG: glycine cleavage system protein T [Acidobacteria bacterium RIFCSPLOWO2_12_FULL_67_14b]|nr:MAG: glycine cleavage system protein T [Acidobacteria bacterium RIFCSPLOWO2_12_FULL_67_14b]
MADSAGTPLKRTPLHFSHVALGARMVPFGGWDMPVEYSGITAEHMAVRTAAGLFDVSHMGEVEIAGKGALEAVQHITSNDASKLQVGQIQYSALTTPEGAFVDDLLVYRFGPSHFLLVINAGGIDKDYAWIAAKANDAVPGIATHNSSSRYALIAIQGPKAQQILQTQTDIDLQAIKYYWFAHGEIAAVRGTVSRTGYTGEDGFEVMVPPAMAAAVWDALMQAGKPHGLIPAGLGARDTLRLEAAMRLYGNDIDDSTTVLEADLGWIVGWNKPEFLGRAALVAQKAKGTTRTLVGFEMIDRAIGRHGHAVFYKGEPAGVVTSGTQTPFLKKAIGMAYVPTSIKTPGTEIEIDIRGRRAKAVIVPMPFYKRPKKS